MQPAQQSHEAEFLDEVEITTAAETCGSLGCAGGCWSDE